MVEAHHVHHLLIYGVVFAGYTDTMLAGWAP